MISWHWGRGVLLLAAASKFTAARTGWCDKAFCCWQQTAFVSPLHVAACCALLCCAGIFSQPMTPAAATYSQLHMFSVHRRNSDCCRHLPKAPLAS